MKNMRLAYGVAVCMLLAAYALSASLPVEAQSNCLQREVGPPPSPNASHWIVTNVCGYTVRFKASMTNGQATYNVYTTPLGKLVDGNPGLPVTITLKAGDKQSFYFGNPGGTWTFVTDNVTKAN